MKKEEHFRSGPIELLVLHLLSQKDFYGYELVQTIKTQSGGKIDIPAGSLYPALYKLMEKGYISSYEKQAGKRQVHVYYHLESTGKERLTLLRKSYQQINQAIQNILNHIETDTKSN